MSDSQHTTDRAVLAAIHDYESAALEAGRLSPDIHTDEAVCDAATELMRFNISLGSGARLLLEVAERFTQTLYSLPPELSRIALNRLGYTEKQPTEMADAAAEAQITKEQNTELPGPAVDLSDAQSVADAFYDALLVGNASGFADASKLANDLYKRHQHPAISHAGPCLGHFAELVSKILAAKPPFSQNRSTSATSIWTAVFIIIAANMEAIAERKNNVDFHPVGVEPGQTTLPKASTSPRMPFAGAPSALSN